MTSCSHHLDFSLAGFPWHKSSLYYVGSRLFNATKLLISSDSCSKFEFCLMNPSTKVFLAHFFVSLVSVSCRHLSPGTTLQIVVFNHAVPRRLKADGGMPTEAPEDPRKFLHPPERPRNAHPFNPDQTSDVASNAKYTPTDSSEEG